MRSRMLITEAVAEETFSFLHENGVEVKRGTGFDEESVIRDLQDCDAVMVRILKITRRVIEACPRLKVIAKHGAGCDSIDVEAAREHGIRVVYTPGANAQSVAEHTMALMLACARQLRLTNQCYADGDMSIKDQAGITELGGKVLGLIGCGRIARHVARMAHDGFGMRVLGYDPFTLEEHFPAMIQPCVNIDDILRQSDYVSLHIPATKENIHLINREKLALMKSSAYLINTARGAIVDEEALVEAVIRNEIAGAGLDVSQSEPASPSSTLFSHPRILLTPHSGAASYESMVRMGIGAAQGAIDVLNGKEPEYPFA